MTPPSKLWTTWLAPDKQEMVQKCYIKKQVTRQRMGCFIWQPRCVIRHRTRGFQTVSYWKGNLEERPRVSALGWTSLTQNSLSCYCVPQYFQSFSRETGGLFIPATCGVKACSRFGWKLAQQRWPTFTSLSSSKLKYYIMLRVTHLIWLSLLEHFRQWCTVLNAVRGQRAGNTVLT